MKDTHVNLMEAGIVHYIVIFQLIQDWRICVPHNQNFAGKKKQWEYLKEKHSELRGQCGIRILDNVIVLVSDN